MSFNGDRLRILRRFHNLTQRELGELAGAPASTITGYERGVREPKGMALDALAASLRVLPGFFVQPRRDDEFIEGQAHFRSLTSTPDRLRKKILAHATLFGILIEYLTTSVRLPTLKLPAIHAATPNDIERAAERSRVEWGVGTDAPIKNVVRMIEHAGVVVTVLDTVVSEKIDAFSRYGMTNLIVLNPIKGVATRARFDVAHEAGHAVLHRYEVPNSLKQREAEANHFAGALLMPQKAFGREFWGLGHARSWEQLFALKERWGASVASIIKRGHQLGLVDAAEYRRRFKYMARQGWLSGAEPDEPGSEIPELFPLALKRFQAVTGKTAATISSEIGWTPELFEHISGVEMQPIHDPTVFSIEAGRQRRRATG